MAGDDTAEVMRAAARLHPNNAGGQLLRQPDQRLASHPALHDNRAGRVEAGAKASDLARKHGVSEATLYNSKAKYGDMDVSEAKRLKQVKEEGLRAGSVDGLARNSGV